MGITVNRDEKKEILLLFMLLLDNNKITSEEYRRAVDALNTKFEAVSDERAIKAPYRIE